MTQCDKLYDADGDWWVELLRLAAKRKKQGPLLAAEKSGRQLWDGLRLKELREHVRPRLTQPALAKLASVSVGEISRHERNVASSNPSVDSLGRLALALGQPLHVLMQPPGSPIPPAIIHVAGHGTDTDSQVIRKNHNMEEQMSSSDDISGGPSDVLHSNTGMAHHLPGSAFHAIKPSRAISASEERLGTVAVALKESADYFREAIKNLEALAKAFSVSLAKLETGDQTASAGHQSSKSHRPRK